MFCVSESGSGRCLHDDKLRKGECNRLYETVHESGHRHFVQGRFWHISILQNITQCHSLKTFNPKILDIALVNRRKV